MQWTQHMNAAMDYIEENLEGELDPAQIARRACCSSFHFQRMFAYIAGIPLGEYIRRRRMTRAAEWLCAGMSVTQAAAQCGYESPTAFSRAFRSVHGLPPSQARSGALRAYMPMRFSLAVSGGAPLTYRMEALGAFNVMGLAAPIGSGVEENFQSAPGVWERAVRENALPRLLEKSSGPLPGLLGASAQFGEEWRYMVGVCAQEACEGFEIWSVPACEWAVFFGSGAMPGAIQALERRAVLEWLPDSGYEYADAPDIEVYIVPEPQSAVFEVWLPVTRA